MISTLRRVLIQVIRTTISRNNGLSFYLEQPVTFIEESVFQIKTRVPALIFHSAGILFRYQSVNYLLYV